MKLVPLAQSQLKDKIKLKGMDATLTIPPNGNLKKTDSLPAQKVGIKELVKRHT